jgi:ATP-dependent Clp protease adapter protein ClpS
MNATLFSATTHAPAKKSKPRVTPVKTPKDKDESTPAMEEFFQVILHNDDHNEAGYVARSLMQVFGHGEDLAVKIMMEAHRRGRAIAEVEAESPAIQHRDQLRGLGLSSTVEKV